jgi:hypothetical protein
MMYDVLTRKVMLVVGLSIDSPNLGPLLATVKDVLAKQARPTGFWLLGPSDPPHAEKYLIDRNMVPIRLTDYSQYPDILYKVCRSALAQFEST